ncbi:MAG: FKBP-type peptidyl-prolyl cis-trans isomerase [Lachnospiraceae bacterium]|nr:FKBP-type peptidyl-prolyl cis-trans isomerase [Lachnospiraceae bacterium]
MSTQEISKSKQKRLAMENARRDVKKKKNLTVFWAITIPLLIVALILVIIFYRKSQAGEYGKYLLEDGRIDITTSDYAFIDTTSMNFAKADIAPSDEEIESDINSQLASHQVLSEDDSLTIATGAKVKVAYSAILNGEPYASVSEEEGGFDMNLGYASLAKEVDDALIGAKKGDTLTIPVSYAEDYGVESLNGQTITYTVTVLGIYEAPAFNDAFVQEFLSEDASTAEEYKQLLYDQYYQTNLESAIYNFIADNTVVKKQPEDFNKNSFKLLRRMNNEQFQATKEQYAAYGINVNHVYELQGYDNQKDYEAQLKLDVENETAFLLGVQLIYEQSGLTNSPEEVKSYFLNDMGYDETTFNELVEECGMKYLANAVLSQKVINYLVETVPVK